MDYGKRDLEFLIYSITHPVYQPCGKKLNFISNFTGVPQLWEQDPYHRMPTQPISKENVTFVTYINGTRKRIVGVDIYSNEKEQLLLLQEDGSTIPLTNSPEHIHRYGGSSPDGKWIAWSSNRRNPAYYDVYIQNIETLEFYQVLKGDGIYYSMGWSPDGSSLLIEKTNSQLDNDLLLLHLDSKQINWLTIHEGEASFHDPHFNQSGDHLFVLTNKDREFMGLAMIEISTKKLTWLEQKNWDFERLTISKDKTKLAYSVNEAGISRGYLLDLLTSSLYHWETPMGVIMNYVFSPNNDKLAFVFNGPKNPTNIWALDLISMEVEQLTNLSPSPGVEETMIEPSSVSYLAFDKLQIPTFIYKPKVLAAKQPAVFYIHGGPESQFRPTYNPFFQKLLQKGYTIYAPNIRGSTGYGKSYTHLDDNRKRMDSVKDVITLAELLNAGDYFRQRKIAIMGGSYGGFVVLAAITHFPHLWSAAIDMFGISSIRSFLTHTSPWRKILREKEYGTIEKDGPFFDRIDPIHFIDRIISPLLVIHGANDPRVPKEESDRIVSQLKKKNHPVKYILLEDEGHSLNKPQNKLYVFSQIYDFLDQYLGQEKPPTN
ncbi:alpha/beta fold hydrolase [Neobacillus sp. D3-1R]|uniref:S9 family peptidase n=1 Tax=Neobacillus sp. D3-1R TaxID=3445778 RepID=UPI003FA0B830